MSESSDISKFEMEVANLCNLRLFANKFVCTVLTDQLTPKFDENCDTVRFRFFQITNWRLQIFATCDYLKYICVPDCD